MVRGKLSNKKPITFSNRQKFIYKYRIMDDYTVMTERFRPVHYCFNNISSVLEKGEAKTKDLRAQIYKDTSTVSSKNKDTSTVL